MMSNKKRIAKLLKLKYKANSSFPSKWAKRSPDHFIDALRYYMMKHGLSREAFRREYFNDPVPEEPIVYIPEIKMPAIPMKKHIYAF